MATDIRLPMELVKTMQNDCHEIRLSQRVIRHEATYSAAETQGVLPTDCLVQKSVTGLLGDKIVLWTGVSDYEITRHEQHTAAHLLGLSHTSDHTLNPSIIDPLGFYGMAEGMVSPFLVPGSPAASELAAVCVLSWPQEWEHAHSVAISLSLHESLVIPLAGLHRLLDIYLERTFPRLPVLRIEREASL